MYNFGPDLAPQQDIKWDWDFSLWRSQKKGNDWIFFLLQIYPRHSYFSILNYSTMGTELVWNCILTYFVVSVFSSKSTILALYFKQLHFVGMATRHLYHRHHRDYIQMKTVHIKYFPQYISGYILCCHPINAILLWYTSKNTPKAGSRQKGICISWLHACVPHSHKLCHNKKDFHPCKQMSDCCCNCYSSPQLAAAGQIGPWRIYIIIINLYFRLKHPYI